MVQLCRESESSNWELVERLCVALQQIGTFSVSDCVKQLQEHINNVSGMDTLLSNLGVGSPSEPIQAGKHLSSADARELLQTLAHASVARALSNVSSSDDPYGFRSCIDKDFAETSLVDCITRLTGYCYADYIDRHLVQQRLPTLGELQQRPGFCKAFCDDFLSSESLEDDVMYDGENDHDAYSSSMIFIANYFMHDATPKIHAASEIWDTQIGTLASIRVSNSLSTRTEAQSAVHLAARALSMNYGSLHRTTPDVYLRPPTANDISEPFRHIPLDEEAKWTINNILDSGLEFGDWKSKGHLLLECWNGQEYLYQQAIRSHVKAEVPHYEDAPPMFSGEMTMPPPQVTVVTVVKGERIKEWMNEVRSSYPNIITSAAPQNWTRTTRNSAASCFVGGTQVITRDGTKSIENLRENDWLVTDGERLEFGLVSDEKVVTPVKSPLIHGFNHEAPFFTAGHVFHTTTGRRAVDPSLAMKENPWLDVGRLSVGHVLYRLSPGSSTYEEVMIESIHSQQMPEVEYVYGVHLREGRRRYHANGYLVAVNYPEITMKGIAKMLDTIPPENRVSMLRALQELSPLFERFGIATVMDRFHKELHKESTGPITRLYTVSSNSLADPSHRMVRFIPEEIPGESYEDMPAPLPQLTLREGVAAIDDKICENVTIDKQTIYWTRKLEGHQIFEHGLLQIDSISAAHGRISYSRDIGSLVPASIKEKQFFAFAVDLDSPPSYLDTVNSDSPPPVYSGPRILADGTGRKNPLLTPKTHNMIFGRDHWKAGEVHLDDPLPFGSIELGLYRQEDGAEHSPNVVATVPALDDLCCTINKNITDSKLGQLKQLYRTSRVKSKDGSGNEKIRIEMTRHALELLYEIQDPLLEDNEDENPYSVTFKKSLNTDVSLGMLFSSLEFTLGPDHKTASGSIWEYNPRTATRQGTRHTLISDPSSIARGRKIATRREAVEAAKTIPHDSRGTSTPHKPATQPAQSPRPINHLNEIRKAESCNANDLDASTRALLQKVMYYHMKSQDREQIYGFEQPEVPDSLGKSLPSSLSSWIRDTYAPAFTALEIIRSAPTKGWTITFTDKEKARINYFWTGQGSKCLAGSKKYKQLNRMCVREAMLKLTKLGQYLDEGPRWATAYYNDVWDNRQDDILLEIGDNGSRESLDKYCVILDVLDPDTNYSRMLYDAICAKADAVFSSAPSDIKDDDIPWIPQALTWLREGLAEDKGDIDPELRKALLKDLQEFLVAQGVEDARFSDRVLASMNSELLNTLLRTPKFCEAFRGFGRGLWYRSSTVAIGEPHLHSMKLSHAGGKFGTLLKCLYVFGIGVFAYYGPKFSPGEIGQLGTNIGSSVLDILYPHIVKQAPRSALAAEIELAVIGEKIEKAPRNWGRAGLEAKRDEIWGEIVSELTHSEENATVSFFSRLRGRIGIPAVALRLLGIALGVAFVGFLIWDLVAHGNEMSTGQKTLAVLQIVLEVAVVICEIASLLTTVAWIPVLGQILVIATLIVGILIMIFGDTEHQKTPGEKFIESMRGSSSWLVTMDDPPTPLLTYSINQSKGRQDSEATIEITAVNATNRDLTILDPDAQFNDTGTPATDTLISISLEFTEGTDKSCLFAHGSASRADTLSWTVDVPTPAAFKSGMSEPNGKSDPRVICHRMWTTSERTEGKVGAKLKAREQIRFTVRGQLNKAGASTITVTEKRPGALDCVKEFTYEKE